MRKRDLFPGSRLTSQRSLWRYRLYEPPLIEGEGREREDSDGERGRKPPPLTFRVLGLPPFPFKEKGSIHFLAQEY